MAEHFRPGFDVRRNKFAWYGTHQLFHPVSLIFRETAYGVLIAHAYQYSDTLSTFLVEVDPASWHRVGLDTATEEESHRFCELVFAEDLGGHSLLGNRSNWFQASAVRNEHWSHGKVVLLGDALRSVHFSLGSGTRMAMQDAIALCDAVCAHRDDVPAAFQAFESKRRDASAKFQDAARRSAPMCWPRRYIRLRVVPPVWHGRSALDGSAPSQARSAAHGCCQRAGAMRRSIFSWQFRR